MFKSHYFSDTKNDLGEYKIQGEYGGSPMARSHGAAWTTSTDFCIFGGLSFKKLGDVWCFDMEDEEWKWMYGSKPSDEDLLPSLYEKEGVFHETNSPGSLSNGVVVETSQNMFLVGGALTPDLLSPTVWIWSKSVGKWAHFRPVAEWSLRTTINAVVLKKEEDSTCVFLTGGSSGHVSYKDSDRFPYLLDSWEFCVSDSSFFVNSMLRNLILPASIVMFFLGVVWCLFVRCWKDDDDPNVDIIGQTREEDEEDLETRGRRDQGHQDEEPEEEEVEERYEGTEEDVSHDVMTERRTTNSD